MAGLHRFVRRIALSVYHRQSIRLVLLVGFSLTLGLWLLAGHEVTRQMAAVENDANAVNVRYERGQDLLGTVRTQLLLGSVYVRDSLLDSDPAVLDESRRRLDETYVTINAALGEYVPILDSTLDERDRIASLSRAIEDYRISMDEILDTPIPSPRVARQLLNDQVMPRNALLVSLSEEIQALNRSAFIRQQDVVGQIYRSTQQQVWRQLGLAVALSLGIALLATVWAGRLEGEIQRRAEVEAASRVELQRLSARLLRAQEDERRSMARELHDEVGQALTALKVELAMAQRALEPAGQVLPPIEAAKSLADGMLHAVRNLSRVLHPAVLDDLGLSAAVDAYAREFGARYGIAVSVANSGAGGRLGPKVETAAYRIIQEALTNVARHSRASTCSIRMTTTDMLEIVIEDNGVGFDATARAADGRLRGLGLLGIRERAAEAGGEFTLDTAVGRGTRLHVHLPAHPRSESTVPGADRPSPITHRSPQWES